MSILRANPMKRSVFLKQDPHDFLMRGSYTPGKQLFLRVLFASQRANLYRRYGKKFWSAKNYRVILLYLHGLSYEKIGKRTGRGRERIARIIHQIYRAIWRFKKPCIHGHFTHGLIGECGYYCSLPSASTKT